MTREAVRLAAWFTATVLACAWLLPTLAHPASLERLEVREHRQHRVLRHYTGTVRFFHHHPRLARTTAGRRAAHKARVWVRVVRRELADTHRERRQHLAARRTLQSASTASSVGYWAGRQIAAATVLGAESAGDPWPMCPDPFDGGGSWYDTLACENSGSWYDSPGYYRCGLQFDPAWERRFGRLCP